MSFEQVRHEAFEGYPHTHLFTTSEPAGSVVFRTDAMQQVLCSPRGGQLVKDVLSGKATSDVLPLAIREFACAENSGLPESAGGSARTGLHDVQTLCLVPTMDCQLRCGYCRITQEQGRQKGLRLSPQDACDAIDRVLGVVPPGTKRTLVFFGGEPLLGPETVFAAIAHVRRGTEADNTSIMLQTNGVAIDASTAAFLAANDVLVYLSLDGVAEVHDRQRKLAGGGSSYERSVAGYRNAKEHGCCMAISATATKQTADRFASSFDEMIGELLPDKCGVVTHLHPLATGRSPHQCSAADSARLQIATYLAAREKGIYHQQMCEKVGPFVSGNWRRYACAGCGGKAVIAPDGKAGICEYNAGDGRSFVPLQEFSPDTVSDFLSWAARSPLDTGECMHCPALPICGGGCAYDSQVVMGDPLTFDPWLCEANIKIIHWLMQDLLSHLQDRLNGADFHEVTPEERALTLGNIPLNRALAPMPSIAEFREVPKAGTCTPVTE